MNSARRFILLCSLFVASEITVAESGTPPCEFVISEGSQSIRRFSLTEAVFLCIKRPGYKGLSVVNADNVKVPFEIQTARTDTQLKRSFQELKLYPEPDPSPYKTGDQIRRIANLTGVHSGTEVDRQWQLKNKYYSSLLLEQPGGEEQLVKLQLDLDTSDTPLSAVLLVEASNDLQHWTTVLEPYYLYSLPGAQDQLQNFDLPIRSVERNRSTQPRYLRLAMLSNLPDIHQKMGKITGEFQTQEQQPIVPQWLTIDRLEATDEQNQWQFQLPGLFPISRIRLNPATDIAYYQGNVSVLPYRDPQVKASEKRPHDEGKKKLKALLHGRKLDAENKPSWRWIANFNQYLLNLGSGTVRSGDISLNQVAAKNWKLTFNQPTIHKVEMLPTVELGWIAPQVTFLTQGPGPYRLLTGEEDTHTLSIPRHIYRAGESAEMVALIDDNTAAQHSNSPQGTNESATDTTTVSVIDWKKAVLWLVLGLGVLVMGVIAFRLSRVMNADDEP